MNFIFDVRTCIMLLPRHLIHTVRQELDMQLTLRTLQKRYPDIRYVRSGWALALVDKGEVITCVVCCVDELWLLPRMKINDDPTKQNLQTSAFNTEWLIDRIDRHRAQVPRRPTA